jgi:hypothetical protein
MRAVFFAVILGSVAISVFDSSSESASSAGVTGKTTGDPIGLWVIPETERQDPARGNCSAPTPFFFDGQAITLRLYQTKVWEVGPEDGFYRMKSKWVDNNLYWLPPFGTWQKKATFRDNRFEVELGGLIWTYSKVLPNQASEDLRPFLKTREIRPVQQP